MTTHRAGMAEQEAGMTVQGRHDGEGVDLTARATRMTEQGRACRRQGQHDGVWEE